MIGRFAVGKQRCRFRGAQAESVRAGSDDTGMAQNFIGCDREQVLLMPPSLREWLPEGHLAWFVIDAVAEMDLTAFYAAYRADGHGRAAHDPAMMVALLLYTYWHHDQMDALASHGIQVLIPPDAGKRRGARPGWDGSRYAFMRRVLETELGKQLYGKRQVTIEPVFANTKFNRRLDRFLRRCRSACRSEWRLITATHNLLKLHTHGIATAGA